MLHINSFCVLNIKYRGNNYSNNLFYWFDAFWLAMKIKKVSLNIKGSKAQVIVNKKMNKTARSRNFIYISQEYNDTQYGKK